MFENIKLDPTKTFSRSTKDKNKINRVRENTKETEDDFTRFAEDRTSNKQPRCYAECKAMKAARAAAETGQDDVPLNDKRHEAPRKDEQEEIEVLVLGHK